MLMTAVASSHLRAAVALHAFHKSGPPSDKYFFSFFVDFTAHTSFFFFLRSGRDLQLGTAVNCARGAGGGGRRLPENTNAHHRWLQRSMFELRDAPRPVSGIGANTVRVEHSTRAHQTRADTMTPYVNI